MYQRLAESPACFICGWEVGLERYFPPYVVSERIFCIESILLFVPGVSMNLVFFFYDFNAYDETAELLCGS